jgi:hypothetical protein
MPHDRDELAAAVARAEVLEREVRRLEKRVEALEAPMDWDGGRTGEHALAVHLKAQGDAEDRVEALECELAEARAFRARVEKAERKAQALEADLSRARQLLQAQGSEDTFIELEVLRNTVKKREDRIHILEAELAQARLPWDDPRSGVDEDLRRRQVETRPESGVRPHAEPAPEERNRWWRALRPRKPR